MELTDLVHVGMYVVVELDQVQDRSVPSHIGPDTLRTKAKLQSRSSLRHNDEDATRSGVARLFSLSVYNSPHTSV